MKARERVELREIINEISGSGQHMPLSMRQEYEVRIVNLLTIPGVSISKAKEYAEFCVECDRKGMKLLELNDWLKL